VPGRCRGPNLSAPDLGEAVESEGTCSVGLRRRARDVEDTARQRLPLQQVTYAWLELVGPEGRLTQSLLQEHLRASSHPRGGGSAHLLCRRWRMRRRLPLPRLPIRFEPEPNALRDCRPDTRPSAKFRKPDSGWLRRPVSHGTLSSHAWDQSWRAGRWQERYRPGRRSMRTAWLGWALKQLELTWPPETPFLFSP
jgi:hypothetical protein